MQGASGDVTQGDGPRRWAKHEMELVDSDGEKIAVELGLQWSELRPHERFQLLSIYADLYLTAQLVTRDFMSSSDGQAKIKVCTEQKQRLLDSVRARLGQ